MRVRVPASSANLGPGFDSFGLAWQLYNEIDFDLSDTLSIHGCDERYRGENNLARVAYCRAMESCGRKSGGLSINFVDTGIPVSRGLGSSAALIAAGVLAANELNHLGLDLQALMDVAASVEGHPDNIAPALCGGLTVSLMEGASVVTRRFPISAALNFTLLIPPFELSTALSRSVMPREVDMKDAVFNLSRAALLPRALAEGDASLLACALEDRLHQPYRFSLIDGCDKAKSLADSLGAAGFCISGAGSTLLCMASDRSFGEEMKKAMSEVLPAWRVIEVKPDLTGAVVL